MARNAKNTRMCAGCRTHSDKNEFVRIFRTKDGSIFLASPGTNDQGRSVYICPNQKCLDTAIKRKSFSRSFKCEMPPDLYDRIQTIVKSINAE